MLLPPRVLLGQISCGAVKKFLRQRGAGGEGISGSAGMAAPRGTYVALAPNAACLTPHRAFLWGRQRSEHAR